MMHAVATATSVPSSAGRVPQMSRLSTSRPNESVPSRCWPVGPPIWLERSCLIGSYGARNGARSPISASTTMNPIARAGPRLRLRVWTAAAAGPATSRTATCSTTCAMALPPDPRVEDGVRHVHRQVDENDDRHEDRHHALHDREVLLADPVDQHRAHPRDDEHALDQDRHAQQGARDEADDRDDGDQRVLEREAEVDLAPGQPERPRGADER